MLVVWLHLIVWNADNGTMLAEVERQMPSYIEHPDSCLQATLPEAHRIVDLWRKKYPNSFANIDCEFRRGMPSDPA